MSILSVGSHAGAAAVHKPTPTPQSARSPDGDYLKPGVGRSTAKDADGDYKPNSPLSQTSGPSQAAITDLQKGG
jgi:hypothetical protein